MNTGVHRRRAGRGPSGGGTSFPLDGLPSPLVAYSTRQLLSTFIEQPMQVSRDSDGSIVYVPFSNGELDTATLLAFVGASVGRPYTLRDQCGNSRHLLQSTSARRPIIADSSAVRAVNGKPALFFDDNSWMRFTGGIGMFSSLTALHHVAVIDVVDKSPQGYRRVFSWTNFGQSDFSDAGFMAADHRGSNTLEGWAAGLNSVRSSVGVAPGVLTLKNSASQIIAGLNGTDGTTRNISYTMNQWSEITLGQRGDTSSADTAFSGYLGEYIVWPQTLTTEELSAYLDNARAYWGTP